MINENRQLKKFKEDIEEEKKNERNKIEAKNTIENAIKETEENEIITKTIEVKEFVLKNFILNERFFNYIENIIIKIANQFLDIYCRKFIDGFKISSENLVNMIKIET